MAEATLEEIRPSCIRGYHIYKDIWTPVIDEELQCRREPANIIDRYAVAVLKSGTIVGHLPKKISRISSLFIRRGGQIKCEVTGRRRRSADLVQGGLEVPCDLTFKSTKKELEKINSLLSTLS